MSIVLYPGVNWSMNCAQTCAGQLRPVAIPKTLEKMATNATKTLGHSQPLITHVLELQPLAGIACPDLPAPNSSFWAIWAYPIWGERSKEHQAKNEHGQRDLHNAKGIDVTIFSCPGWKLETTLIALEIALVCSPLHEHLPNPAACHGQHNTSRDTHDVQLCMLFAALLVMKFS